MKLTSKSFTLVEILITLVIFTVMLASIYTISSLSQQSWKRYLATVKPKQEALRAVTWMTNELREAKNPFITEDKNRVQLSFERPDIGQVIYTWSSEGQSAGQLIRTNYNKQFIIAYELSQVKFTSTVENEITIDVSAGKLEPFNLKQKAALRYKSKFFSK